MSAVAISGLSLASEPRAQLLPASVKAREKSRSARQMMAVLVVFAVVLVGAGVTWAYFGQLRAQHELDAANARTNEILAEQGKYAEASRLASLVQQTLAAQQTVTSTEIQWLPVMNAISAYLPADASISGLALQVSAPWEPALAAEGPLRAPRAAVIQLDISAPGYDRAAMFVQNITTLYAFADVKIDSTEFASGAYVTHLTLTLDADALSQRFAATDAAAPDGTGGTTTDGTTDGEGTNP